MSGQQSGGSRQSGHPFAVPSEPARATAPGGLPIEASSAVPTHIDRYEIRNELGRGAMGSVFAAWDPKLCREVAIKIVATQQRKNAKGRARFLREARSIAAIGQANVVQIFDYSGLDSESLYLVMEKLEGRDLWELMHSHRLFPEAIAALIGHELCLALEAAHQVGIIHRDLKPENVFLTHGGRVVLTDFGIVKAIADDAVVEGYTERTEVIGTPGFMAPELLRGKVLTPATDLFALGALLYNVATMQMPYEGASPVALLQAAQRGDYVDPRRYQPHLSQAFCDLLRTCLQNHPSDRPTSASEMRVHLKAILDDLAEHSFGDDLLAWLTDPIGFADESHQRAVGHALSEMTVAAARGQRTAALAHKQRLLALDPFNEDWRAILTPLTGGALAGNESSGPPRRRPTPALADELMQTLPALRLPMPRKPAKAPRPQAAAPRRVWPRLGVAAASLAIAVAGAWQAVHEHEKAFAALVVNPACAAADSLGLGQRLLSARPEKAGAPRRGQYACGPLHLEVVTASVPQSLPGETPTTVEAVPFSAPVAVAQAPTAAPSPPAASEPLASVHASQTEKAEPDAGAAGASAQADEAAEAEAWATAPLTDAPSAASASGSTGLASAPVGDPAATADGATLEIDVDGRGAWLIVDGRAVGHVHQQSVPVAFGRHRVVLVMGPGSILRRWLNVGPGEHSSWRATHAFIR